MEKILRYQELDGKLMKLDKQINQSPEKETMSKMIKYVKEAQSKSYNLENSAKGIIMEIDRAKKVYENTLTSAEKLSKMTLNALKEDELNKLIENINVVASELFNLEKKLNFLTQKAKEVLKDFEVTKQNVMKARAKHKESKEKFEQLNASIEPQKNEIIKEMQQLEKEISPDMLTRYKNIKHDNTFPVYVPLRGKLCGGCMMELASGKIDKLKQEKYIRCEQCGRIIYLND